MASTWSALKVELLATGENSGTWGTLTNANLGDAVLGEAITGSATVDFATDADVTITLTDAATTQSARNLRLNITESSTGIGSVRNLILGSGCQIEKFYLINNTGTGAKTVKNTSGTGISVPGGKATLVYNNGTNVVDGASYFTSLTLGSALPVASGGTGLTAGTSGGVLAYTATGTLASSAALTQYGVVYGGGAGAVPVATASGTTGQILTATTGGAPSWAAPATSGTVTAVSVASANGFAGTSSGGATPALTLSTSITGVLKGNGTAISAAVAGTDYVAVNGALGTPSSGTVTNLTGTASININGTVGATTATTGAFTTLSATGVTTVQAGTAALPAITTTGDTNTGIFFPAADTIAFSEGGVEAMRIDSAGNVGIGTASPTAQLNLNAATDTTAYNGAATDGQLTAGATQLIRAAAGANTNVAQLVFQTRAAQPFNRIVSSGGTAPFMAFVTNNAERTRIDSSGNVGIGTSSQTSMLQTAGSSSVSAFKTPNIAEVATVSATAATGTINFDTTTQSVLYYTTNASGNFTVNFRGSSGTTQNTIMATGESLSATFLVTNGATAYYNSAVQVDGSSVTPKWQGGTAPTSGNASAIDSYTYVIIKTGSAAFTVLASVTKFA